MLIRDAIEAFLRWLFPDLFAAMDALEVRVVELMADVYYRRHATAPLVN